MPLCSIVGAVADTAVGALLGTLVGTAVGTTVGTIVGTTVGTTVGAGDAPSTYTVYWRPAPGTVPDVSHSSNDTHPCSFALLRHPWWSYAQYGAVPHSSRHDTRLERLLCPHRGSSEVSRREIYIGSIALATFKA